MAGASPSSPILSFGLYELDPSRWELRREGMLIRLQLQPCQLLYLLASHPQAMLGRDEIRRYLWPEESVGEFGPRINFCIAQIREALGDSAENPRFVKTVRGQGYCFLAPSNDPTPPAPAPPPAPESTEAPRRRWLVPAAVAAVIAIAAGALALRRWAAPRPLPSITVGPASTLMVTHGETLGLIYSRGYVYYTAAGPTGREALFRVAESGGSPQALLSGLDRPEALAISPDGHTLVVGQSQFIGVPSPDWLLPVQGGKLQPFGEVSGPAVAWRPDGRAVAFFRQNRLMLADGSGSHARLLAQFSAMDAGALAWSPDGRTLAVATEDPVAGCVSIWLEAASGGQPRLGVGLLGQMLQAPDDLMWLPSGRQLLIGTGSRSDAAHSVLAITLSSSRGKPAAVQTLWTSGVGALSGPALDGQERLLIGDAESNATSLLRWQPSRQQFALSLDGVRELDYSPDHSQIAYVRGADSSLWIARTDGSDPRELVRPPEQTMLPRWSPDGKQIAYAAFGPKGNWRLYLLAADGPALPEALPNPDPANGQGAPTWLPDGRGLIYGSTDCTEAATCGVHQLDLITRHDTMIPGSAGLRTARLSPNGRWIAALKDADSAIMLYDRQHPKHGWRALWPHPIGDYVAWSADSRSLFFVTLGPEAAEVERITVPGGAARVVATEAAPRPGFVQPFDWFGLGPGDVPLLSLARIELQIEAIPLHRR